VNTPIGSAKHTVTSSARDCSPCAAEQRDECAALHLRGDSITSSARASSGSGTTATFLISTASKTLRQNQPKKEE
jgi:hypothetical protein